MRRLSASAQETLPDRQTAAWQLAPGCLASHFNVTLDHCTSNKCRHVANSKRQFIFLGTPTWLAARRRMTGNRRCMSLWKGVGMLSNSFWSMDVADFAFVPAVHVASQLWPAGSRSTMHGQRRMDANSQGACTLWAQGWLTDHPQRGRLQELAGSHASSTIFAMFRYIGDLHSNTKAAVALLTHSRPAIPLTHSTTGGCCTAPVGAAGPATAGADQCCRKAA